MSKFDEVTAQLKRVPYMNESAAKVMRELLLERGARNVLELGFFHGKSSCYIAAVLEDLGAGHLTTIDKQNAKEREPTIATNLQQLGLTHRVTPIHAKRSFTWELARMIHSDTPPKFDFCYLDGGHTWDTTGLAFLLVDMLLAPGGIIVLDDLDWTIAKHLEVTPAGTNRYASYDQDEIEAPGVRRVWDSIVTHLGYTKREIEELSWGVAYKPMAR